MKFLYEVRKIVIPRQLVGVRYHYAFQLLETPPDRRADGCGKHQVICTMQSASMSFDFLTMSTRDAASVV